MSPRFESTTATPSRRLAAAASRDPQVLGVSHFALAPVLGVYEIFVALPFAVFSCLHDTQIGRSISFRRV